MLMCSEKARPYLLAQELKSIPDTGCPISKLAAVERKIGHLQRPELVRFARLRMKGMKS